MNKKMSQMLVTSQYKYLLLQKKSHFCCIPLTSEHNREFVDDFLSEFVSLQEFENQW